MNEKNRPRTGGQRPFRSQADASSRPQGGPPSRTTRPRGLNAEALLEMAEELEEQGRDLLRHARQLQRMAQSLEGGDKGRASRAPRSSGVGEGRSRRPEAGEARPRRTESGEGRSRRSFEGEDRPARPDKRSGEAPAWAPQGKRRRS